MRFSIPHHYPIEMRKPRHRSWQRSYNFAIAEVDIPEVGLGEAKVVFEVASMNEPDRNEVISFKPIPDGAGGVRPARVIEVDDRLYVERCRVSDLHLGSMAKEGSPFDVTLNGEFSRLTLLGPDKDDGEKLVHRHRSKDELEKAASETYAEIADDLGERSGHLIALRAHEMRIFDNSIFTPVSEPQFLVKLDYGSANSADEPVVDTVKICVVESGAHHGAFSNPYGDEGRNAYGLETMCFALDRYAEAKAYAEMLVVMNDRVTNFGVRASTTVLGELPLVGKCDQSSILHDGEQAIRRGVATVVSQRGILDYQDETLAAWVDLRDASRTARSGKAMVQQSLQAFASAAESDPAAPEILRMIAGTALREHEAALAAGRTWFAPSPAPDTYDDAVAAWQAEGWSGMPRHLARKLMAEGFSPGTDRLVVAKSRSVHRGPAAELYEPRAAFVFGDADSPYASVFWGVGDGAGPRLAQIAEEHCRVSRERSPDHLTDDLAELPAY